MSQSCGGASARAFARCRRCESVWVYTLVLSIYLYFVFRSASEKRSTENHCTINGRTAPQISDAAIAHITQPTAASSRRQAAGRRNSGVSQAAPYARPKNQIREPSVAPAANSNRSFAG